MIVSFCWPQDVPAKALRMLFRALTLAAWARQWGVNVYFSAMSVCLVSLPDYSNFDKFCIHDVTEGASDQILAAVCIAIRIL